MLSVQGLGVRVEGLGVGGCLEEGKGEGGVCPVTRRGTSLIKNSAHLGPYSRTMPRALWWPQGGGLFLCLEEGEGEGGEAEGEGPCREPQGVHHHSQQPACVGACQRE